MRIREAGLEAQDEIEDRSRGVRLADDVAGEPRLELALDERAPIEQRDGDAGALLEDLEDLDALVIVDAVAAKEPPGTVVRFEGSRVPAAFSNTLSPHQHGINDLLASLAFLGREPRHVVLLGVQPQRLALGMELSPTVEAVMPELTRRVHAELAAILGRPS